MKTILVPIDFSDGSLAALESADLLARRLGCTLTLLHVVPRPGSGVVPEDGLPADVAEQVWDGLFDKPELLEPVRGEMERFLARAADLGAEQQILYRAGPPATAILDTADKLDARMIVMSTHGRTGLARFFVGSTAEAVVRGASVPVLAVKPFAQLR